MIWHESVGRLSYGPGIRIVLLVDQQIADYYYSLVPKYVDLSRQAYDAHISVVRHEKPTDTSTWGNYESDEVGFEYGAQIFNDETYYWLEVVSPRLREIRKELGLTAYPPWRNGYHLTLGNIKHQRKE
jgi:hypothetical protein